MLSFVIFFFLTLFSFVFLHDINKNEIDVGYDELLNWAKQNNFIISSSIRFVKDKNTKQEDKKILIPAGVFTGIANIGTAIEGVEVAIFAKQKDNGFKLSLRSNRIDVSEICMIFGGGGHKLAAGCYIEASLDQVKKAIVNETIKNLK